MTLNLADFQGAVLSKCRNLQDNITLANKSIVIPDGIGTVLLLFYINGHNEKILLFDVCHCSKLDTKLIFLSIFHKKELAYSLQHRFFSIRDSSSIIMVSRLISHNLYKIEISEALGRLSATLAISREIDFSRAMTAGTLKSAAELFTYHCRLAYLNKASVKQLSIMVPGMEIV